MLVTVRDTSIQVTCCPSECKIRLTAFCHAIMMDDGQVFAADIHHSNENDLV